MACRTRLRLLTGAALLALATPVYAQDDDDGDVIIVTAQKRVQTLQEVPLSVSVVGGDELERLNATEFQDYLALIPGLQLNQNTPGEGRLILRGVNTGGVASTVAVYVDETPFGSSTGLVNAGILAGDFDTFDVARIEVLRGPQGTLYGANSLGGTLKFVTAEPNPEGFEGRVRAGVETLEGGDVGYSGAGVLNMPLGDRAAIRSSGFYRKSGGFIDSTGANGSDVAEDINPSESYGGRVSLLYNATENFSVRLSAILQDIKTDESNLIDIDATTLDPIGGGLTNSRFADSTNKAAYRIYNGTIEWDLGEVSLTSSTSYGTFDQTIHDDFMTFSLAGLVAGILMVPPLELVLDQQTDQRKFTQEVRLSSADNDRFEWMIGGYFTRETGLIDQLVTAVDPGTVNPSAGVPVLADVMLDSEYKEYAGFANATLHLGERFDLTAGGRFSHNDQEAFQATDGLPGLFVGPPEVFPTISSDEGVFTWSVAPRFEINDYAALYARVAKGFRPGGPNVLPPTAPPGTPFTFQSDTILSYEAGVKAQTADNAFAIDISAFYQDWNDVQLFTVVNGFGVNTNTGGARSIGGEATATLRPAEGLSLLATAAITDSELTTDTDPLLVGGLDGETLPFTPKYSFSVSGDYEQPLSDDVIGYAGGTFRFQSSQFSNFSPAGRSEFPSYGVLDLRSGLMFDRFALEVFARNVTNSRGLTSGGTPSTDLPMGVLNAGVLRPRTIGAVVTADF